jgi:hypothetical protein
MSDLHPFKRLGFPICSIPCNGSIDHYSTFMFVSAIGALTITSKVNYCLSLLHYSAPSNCIWYKLSGGWVLPFWRIHLIDCFTHTYVGYI